MFEYVWATPSSNLPVRNHEIYLKRETIAGMNLEEQDRSDVSLHSEGTAAPLLVNHDLVETVSSSKCRTELRNGPRRWYFRRQKNYKLGAGPVRKDHSVHQKEAVPQKNGSDVDGYRIWNQDPRIHDGVMLRAPLRSLENDASATSLGTDDIFSLKQQLSVPIKPTDSTTTFSKSPLNESIIEILTDKRSRASPFEVKEYPPEIFQDNPSESECFSEKGSESATADNELTIFSTDATFEDERALQDTEQSLNALPTPPYTPGLDFKDQQAFFEAVANSNHPSVAREQFQRGQGILWDGALHILQGHFLHPADLTEPEFVALVCSQGNETHTWLETNILPIAHRSVRRWMDAHSMLAAAGIYPGPLTNNLIRSFEWMSDEEQEFRIQKYHIKQLQNLASLRQWPLSTADIEAFGALPITIRASFIKQYMNTDEAEPEEKGSSINLNQFKVEKQDIVTVSESDAGSESSASSNDYDKWVTAALEHAKTLRDGSIPVVDDDVARYLHQMAVKDSHLSTLPHKSKEEAQPISSYNRANTSPQSTILVTSAKTPLAHEVRALEIRTKIPLSNHQSQNATSSIDQLLRLSEDSSVKDRNESINSGIRIRSNSSVKSENSSNTISSCISTETRHDIATPTKAIPTPPRNVTPPRRKLTPIPDITPRPRSVRFHPSTASTVSVDSTMLGISRMKTMHSHRNRETPSDQKREVSSEYSDDNCSIFDGGYRSESQYQKPTSQGFGQPCRVDSSWRLKPLGLRKRFSQAMLVWKGAELEKAEEQPRSLRKKISSVWGSMSLRSKRGKGAL